MKSYNFWAVLCIVLFAGMAHVARAGEAIPSFDARVTVHDNATINVVEKIVYDFGATERHGIFRYIPYSYQAQTETYTADISRISVTDESGSSIPFGESRAGGVLTLKIGDPHTIVTGEQTYVVSYTVAGPFLYFDDHDEFYWNVTGAWPTPITQTTVLVDLPEGAKVLSATCYQGAGGSTKACDNEERLTSNTQAGYTATARNLAPQEGLTVAVAFPKGTIAHPERAYAQQVTEWSYRQFWPLGIPFIVLFVMTYLWSARGRDPQGRGTIVTQFEPPEGLSPSVAGIVYNERVEPREVSAEIVRLAVEGYLKIHRIEDHVLVVFPTTDYLFERIQSEKTPSDPVGVLLLEKLFQHRFAGTAEIDGRVVEGTLLSKMKYKFAEANKELEARMYDEVVARRYFLARPDKVRHSYVAVGVIVGIIGVALAVMGMATMLAVFGVGLGFSGTIIAIGGMWMPVKTKEGVRIFEALEGFKRYLSVAEKDRLAFHNAPERKPELFDAYLPYAIAFGVEEAWAASFKDIYTEKPQWYSGNVPNTLAATALTTDLVSFVSDFASASMPQSSGASGGGSVGGGFGGGGGGSW